MLQLVESFLTVIMTNGILAKFLGQMAYWPKKLHNIGQVKEKKDIETNGPVQQNTLRKGF